MRERFRLTLLGPNRHSDLTVVEQLFEFGEAELRVLDRALDELPGRVRARLRACGGVERVIPGGGAAGGAARGFARLHAATAIALQRSAGHAVDLVAVLERDSPGQGHAVFEHEVAEVGEYASELALVLLAQEFPALDWRSDLLDGTRPFAELHAAFAEFARVRVLPPDTRAIAGAAAGLGIPCVKLEREPYAGLEGEFRIRMNSMLMLGQCRHQQIVDGTLGITRSGHLLPLIGDRAGLMARLEGMPVGQAPAVMGREAFTVIVSNHEVAAVVPAVGIHPSIAATASEVSRRLGAGLVAVSVVTPDPGVGLERAGGAVTDVDPAPRLDDYLAPESPEMRAAAESFVRWLFPKGSPSRVPVVAVTGTNGKTTTSRMVARILHAAGHATALKCSDGSYFNGREIDLGDPPAADPFYRPFESPETEVVVQETHFGRIMRLGFPYRESSVAVCTNVTTDHIGRLGIETEEQMAGVKRAVLERARDAAVLNADDGHCRDMIPHLRAGRLWLVSTRRDAEELRRLAPGAAGVAVLEEIEGRRWIVLHDGERRPVAAVNDIPATFDGTAVCNVYNAMQAVAACRPLAVDPATMRRVLAAFTMDLENAPGRFNIYAGHPFTVMLDFAHNADGIRRIGEFLGTQKVEGRKIILIALSGERSAVDIRAKGRAAAGHFDHFVVRSYPDARGRDRRQAVEEMRRALVAGGVPETAITGIPDPDEARQAILEMGRPGDWLVMTWGSGEAERMWKAITSFRPRPG